MTTKLQYKTGAYDGCLLWFAFFLIPALIGCKTSHELTTVRVEHDSTTERVRDSMTAVMDRKERLHKLEIEAIKNTGVTFQPNCDTIIFTTSLKDSARLAFVVDSVIGANRKLANQVKINKDGSIEASGRLAGAYSNLNTISKENDSLIQVNVMLRSKHESDSLAYKNLQDNTHVTDTSKPGGIFSGFWGFAIIGLGLLFAGLWVYEKFKK